MNKENNIILSPIIEDIPIEKLTAEEYVVMKLQKVENDLKDNIALWAKERENNISLNRKSEKLVKIIDFIFKNFDFEIINDKSLYVSYGHADVDDETLKSEIDKLIKEFKQTEEE